MSVEHLCVFRDLKEQLRFQKDKLAEIVDRKWETTDQ